MIPKICLPDPLRCEFIYEAIAQGRGRVAGACRGLLLLLFAALGLSLLRSIAVVCTSCTAVFLQWGIMVGTRIFEFLSFRRLPAAWYPRLVCVCEVRCDQFRGPPLAALTIPCNSSNA